MSQQTLKYRLGQSSFIILIHVVWRPRGGDWANCAVAFSDERHLVNVDQWSAVHRAFAVETIFKYHDSVTATQRIFRHYNNGRHRTVPARSTIKNWVHTFRTTASAKNEILGGTFRTVRAPENTERVRTTVGCSPKRSAHRHSIASNISNRSHRRILQSDLHLHPCKDTMHKNFQTLILLQEVHFMCTLLP